MPGDHGIGLMPSRRGLSYELRGTSGCRGHYRPRSGATAHKLLTSTSGVTSAQMPTRQSGAPASVAAQFPTPQKVHMMYSPVRTARRTFHQPEQPRCSGLLLLGAIIALEPAQGKQPSPEGPCSHVLRKEGPQQHSFLWLGLSRLDGWQPSPPHSYTFPFRSQSG